MPAGQSTYEIARAEGGSTIKCLRCGRTSYSQGDVKNLYCGACGYHEPPEASDFIISQPIPFRGPSPPTSGRRK